MDLAELIARESVRDLVARYNANADTGRFDQAVAVFAEDAVMFVGDDRYDGREEIRRMFAGTRDAISGQSGAAPAYVRHNTSTLQIDVTSPTTAKSRCYFFVLLDHGLDHWGRYVDEFAEVDGRWVITARKVTVDGRSPGSMFSPSNDAH
jgi:hypothetical protein